MKNTNVMNDVMVFEDKKVEVSIINGEPMFEVYSVGMALGQVKMAKGNLYPRKDRIDENIISAELTPVVHNGQRYINECQLYDLMLEMKTEKVKPFRKWITNEVLPAIRKNGGYIAEDASAEQVTGLVYDWQKKSKYLTEQIHDRKSIRKYIREYEPMRLDECIDEIAEMTNKIKGAIKHQLLDTAMSELRKIDGELVKDTPRHTFIKDTAVAGLVTLHQVKEGKYKRKIYNLNTLIETMEQGA